MKMPRPILLPLVTLAGNAHAALVSHYTFDGNANDSSGAGNNLTAYAVDGTTLPTISATGGRAGGFATFDGQNLFNTTFAPVTGNAPRTFAMFVRTSTDNAGTGGSNSMFFGGWGSPLSEARVRFDLGLNGGTNTQLRNEYNAGATTSLTSTNIIDGAWHHVAVVWDGSTATFYLDGSAYGTAASPAQATSDTIGLSIGGDTRAAGVLAGISTNTPNRFLVGDIDDVRVYDEALDATGIANLASIPEPASSAFLGLAGLGLMIRRRR